VNGNGWAQEKQPADSGVREIPGQEKQEKREWTGKRANRSIITREELAEIIKEHRKWLDSINAQSDRSQGDCFGKKVYKERTECLNLIAKEGKCADLRKANLQGANLSNCNYEPKAGAPPDIPSTAKAKGLSSLTSENDEPHGLVDLREGFKKLGYREQEREVTFAIRCSDRRYSWRKGGFWGKLESGFNWVFFEKTCEYGMSPGRPLLILIGLLFVFWIPYTEAINREGEDRDGIYAVWIAERVRKDLGKDKPERLTLEGLRSLRAGFYFSVLSAFSIGWRELNVGNWIARMQRREYVLKATGWVRTVSGIQSLISVYLVALWALTYFGRPFE